MTQIFIPKVRGFNELRPYILVLTGQTNLADRQASKFTKLDHTIGTLGTGGVTFVYRLEIPMETYLKYKDQIDQLEKQI